MVLETIYKKGDLFAAELFSDLLFEYEISIKSAAAHELIQIAERNPKAVFEKWDRIKEEIEKPHANKEINQEEGYATNSIIDIDEVVGMKFPEKPKDTDFYL